MPRSSVDLSVDFAGVELENPVLSGSGPHGWSGEALQRTFQRGGVGAVITKTLSLEPTPHPRVGRYYLVRDTGGKPIAMHSTEIWTTLPLEKWLKTEFKIAEKCGAPIIASIALYYPDLEKVSKLASLVCEVPGVKMLELNGSCSNVIPSPAEDPKAIGEATKVAKKESSIPLGVKLAPTYNIAECAKAAASSGADWITAINGQRAMSRIDLDTGRPVHRALGGLVGPAIKPIGMRCVAEIGKNVKIPISGVGGISVGNDALEYIMVGATTVQMVTAAIWRGYNAFREVQEGIGKFIQGKGYTSYRGFLKEYKGIALKWLGVPIPKLAEEDRLVAEVDELKCTACAICANSCLYFAMNVNGRAEVNSEKCDGCGICVEICPEKAVKLAKPKRASVIK